MNAAARTATTVSPWLVLATVMLGTLLIGLDRTVVNLALPKIISEFGVTVSTAGWVATTYIISNAVFVPVFGKLGDMFGDRVIYQWSLVGFIAISVLAGFAWNFPSLLVLRALQGLVGAAIYPTAMSLIAKSFTDIKARGQALGIWSASFAASAVIGPLIGGYLIDNFSWRWIFYINLPIGIIALTMVLLFINYDRPMDRGKFDWWGSVILSVAITSLVLVLDRGQEWGWLSIKSIFAYAVGALSTYLFYWLEKTISHPIIDLKFFRNPTLVSIFLISFLSFGGMMGAMFLIPVFSQNFLGFDAVQSGYLFVPMALTMFIVAPIGARISSQFHPRVSISIGMTIAAIGLYLFSYINAATTAGSLVFALVFFAAGLGLSLAPLTNLSTTVVPPSEIGMSSGLLNLVRNIGGAFGIALFATILSNSVESHIYSVAQNTLVPHWTPELEQMIPYLVVTKAQIASYGFVFELAALFMILGVIAAFFMKVPKDLGQAPKTHDMGMG
jgi:DHA2 family multidrug resistance protein